MKEWIYSLRSQLMTANGAFQPLRRLPQLKQTCSPKVMSHLREPASVTDQHGIYRPQPLSHLGATPSSGKASWGWLNHLPSLYHISTSCSTKISMLPFNKYGSLFKVLICFSLEYVYKLFYTALSRGILTLPSQFFPQSFLSGCACKCERGVLELERLQGSLLTHNLCFPVVSWGKGCSFSIPAHNHSSQTIYFNTSPGFFRINKMSQFLLVYYIYIYILILFPKTSERITQYWIFL